MSSYDSNRMRIINNFNKLNYRFEFFLFHVQKLIDIKCAYLVNNIIDSYRLTTKIQRARELLTIEILIGNI